MKKGDKLHIIRGSFKDFEGKFLEQEGDKLKVEVEVFGRRTEISISPSDLEDSEDADKRDALRWRRHLADEWWLKHCPQGKARKGIWKEFLQWNEDTQGQVAEWAEMWRSRCAERAKQYKANPSIGDLWTEEFRQVETLKREAFKEDFHNRLSIDEEASAKRRKASLHKALARFEEIKEEFFSVFGLKLPQQTARFWAFWSSLNSLEKKASELLWRYPAGIIDWFNSAFDKWKLMDGLDHRLYFRYRPAPPEFVCVMTGDSDGLNYGLWYEDPKEEALCVTSFYARDDASIGYCGDTILEAYRFELERSYGCYGSDKEMPEYEVLEKLAMLDELRGALQYFETGDRAEVGSEYEETYGRTEVQQERYPTLDGFGVIVPIDINWDDIFPERPQSGYDLCSLIKEKDEIIANWIANARNELDEGNPYPALVLGRDLHASWGKKELQPVALELMEKAYLALGRQALAEIAKVHHAHRDMKSVEVYLR